MVAPLGGGIFGETSASPTHLNVARLPFVVEEQLGSRVFFRGTRFVCSCRFVVSMGGSEVRVFLCCHLEVLLFP